MQSAGFIDSDGFLTPAGNFEATLSGYDLEPGTAERFRGYFDRGLISEDFSETEDGRIYFMNRGEVLHEERRNPGAFKRWYQLGAWDEHEDKIAPRDPETGEKLPFINMPGGKPSVLGMGLKTLATETAPEAATAAAVGIRAAQPEGIGKFFDWVAGSKVPFTKGQVELGAVMPPGMVKSAWMLRKTREAAGMSLEEMEKVADDMAVASVGKAITEIGRNSTWIWKGLELQEAFIQHKIHGKDAEDAYIQKLYEFEDAMEQFDDMDAVEGMMAGQAFLQIMGEWVGAGQSEEEQQAQIMRARKRVEAARERFSQDELDRMDKNFASGGQFVDLSTPVTVGASIGLRLGAVASKQVVNLNRQIAQKTAQRATVQRYIDKGVQVTAPYVRGGETVLPRGAFKQKVATLTDEIADLQGQLGKLEANTGLGGTFKDLTRGAARKTTEALSKSGRAIAETRLGKWGLEKIDPLVDATKAGLATANKFRGFALVAGGGAGGLAAGGFATGGVLAGAGLLATLPARYNILRAAFMTMRDMGNEFLRRRGTNPYWLRVAEASSENVWARKGALGMDLFRYPARIASKTAEAGAKGIIAETPFAMMGGLHRGPEVWAADAMTEGLFFGSPGMVKGMVHGMGGMPAVAKRAEFDKMALADAAEVRRNLENDQQRDAFDRLGPEHRREVGVYGATFPDIIWRFDPNATGSSWNKQTGVMTIATNSKDPMSALIGHEVAHQIHDRGLTQLVIEELVGPDGALRMTEQEYVLSQAKRNERGEIILPTEAELQAARDRARTNEEGEIVLPSDPGEMGLGPTLPDLLPLNEVGREVKKKYEARMKETISDDTLALEYYADSVGAALSGNRIKLQELARRHPLVRRLIDGTLNKFAFGREFLLRNGVLFDEYGNPAAGQGVMGAIVQSPTLARATETYLRENAGRAAKSVPEKAVERAADQVDILSPEDEDRAIREDIVNYAFDEDGNIKFLPNGRPEGIDDETWKARQTAGLTIIQDLAERYGVEPVTFKNGEQAYRLTRTQWDEVLRLLHESGWYNPRQLKIFDQMIDSIYREEGDSWHLHYHPVYKTDRVGKKRVPRQGRFAKSKLGVPYEITVSKKGNILFRMIDMDTLQNNAEKAFNTKLGKSFYNNTAEIMRDLQTLANNHKAGKSNVSHFGGDEDKVNFLNAIMGVVNKAHQKKNPFFDRPIFKNFKNKHTAIFSTRLDRINRARPANTKALPFRIEEWKKNLMPGPAEGSTPRMGVNINDETQPFTAQILSGEKTIETRDSNSLDPYLNQKVGLVRTGQGTATLVGYADIVGVKKYTTEEEFRKDQDAHLVEPGSEYDWTPKGKVGYLLGNPEAVEPYELSSRGIVSRDIRRMPEAADADHRAAEQAGDMETARKMVDEAATKAGKVKAAHGMVGELEGNTFDRRRVGSRSGVSRGGFSFTTDTDAAKAYAHSSHEESDVLWWAQKVNEILEAIPETSQAEVDGTSIKEVEWDTGAMDLDEDALAQIPDDIRYYSDAIREHEPEAAAKLDSLAERSPPQDQEGQVLEVYLSLNKPQTVQASIGAFGEDLSGVRATPESDVIVEIDNGERVYYVHSPSSIKSADPFTYDDQGNLIPLSERFDTRSDDIRRMPAKPEWVGNPPTFFDPAEPVVSVENQPGFNSGVLRGLHTAKRSVQRAFFQEIEEALAHAKSGDVIAHEMGLAGLLGPKGLKTAEPAPSVWVNKSGKIEINQAVQVGGFVSREAAELYALIRGYYTYQEAVAGYNPVEGGDMTGAQFHLGRNLKTKGEVTGVMRTIKKELREAGIKQRKAAEDFAFYPTPEGFKLVHLGFNKAITPAIRDAAFDAVAEYVNLDDWGEFDTDTFYEANNWTTEDIEEYGEIIKAAPGGEYFRKAIKEKAAALGRPNILAGVDRRVGTRLQGVYEKYSETLGRPGRQPSRRFKDQGALKGEEHGPEAIPVRYKTHRTGELALDKDGKPVPITESYNLTEGSLTEGPHPEPRDPTIGYLEPDELHYDLTGPQRKKLRNLAENGSVDAATDRLVDEATKALDNPEIAAGLGWYSRMRKKLAAALGEHFDIFTQFLGATSAQTPVETNFSYSMEILHQYKNGKFEKVIPSYIALRKAMDNGVEATRSFLESEGVKVRASDKTVAKLAARYIEAKNLSPRRENGKLYGANSNAVLKVLAGVWFEEADAPKTPQFAMNLYGTSLRATIDVWAARTLRRIFYEGPDRWRIQPESETGVNNLDFALGQMVFARAAERLGMNPDDLQALIWFAEKDVWARNGWTGEIGAFKGSFDQAAEVYFPTGRKPRRVDHGRNIIKYLQKLRLVEHDDTLPAPETKDEANKRNDHAKDLQEAATLPGVREWLVETGEAEAS